MRFHMLGLVHLPCNDQYMSCAFTMKVHKLCRMLMSLGHEVILYASEGSNAPCTQFFQTHTLKEIRDTWGEGDNRFEVGYDWTSQDFKHDFDVWTDLKKRVDSRCIEHINKIKKTDDFILLTMGQYNKVVADATGLYLQLEPGIGYHGSIHNGFRSFESSFIRDASYGHEGDRASNGRHYDRVIPNYFDPAHFEYGDGCGGYYLYIGRMIQRKGIQIAADACRILGKKLIIAGQGAYVDANGWLLPTNNSREFAIAPGTWEYVGFADWKKRKELMQGAIATFVPTLYQEPFAGTHIESMLCGTPPITTNFGVFNSTLPDVTGDKVLGFRCDTMQDFVDAARKAPYLNRQNIRTHAEFYLMDNVKYMFEKWFKDLYEVYEGIQDPANHKGWYQVK